MYQNYIKIIYIGYPYHPCFHEQKISFKNILKWPVYSYIAIKVTMNFKLYSLIQPLLNDLTGLLLFLFYTFKWNILFLIIEFKQIMHGFHFEHSMFNIPNDKVRWTTKKKMRNVKKILNCIRIIKLSRASGCVYKQNNNLKIKLSNLLLLIELLLNDSFRINSIRISSI